MYQKWCIVGQWEHDFYWQLTMASEQLATTSPYEVRHLHTVHSATHHHNVSHAAGRHLHTVHSATHHHNVSHAAGSTSVRAAWHTSTTVNHFLPSFLGSTCRPCTLQLKAMYLFTRWLSFFLKTCSYHPNLFCYGNQILASPKPRVSLSPVFRYLSNRCIPHICIPRGGPRKTWRKWLVVWISGNALASINIVALCQIQLVPGWVTSTLRGTVKWVSAFRLSNNNKWW